MNELDSPVDFERLLLDLHEETNHRIQRIKDAAVAPALDGTIGRVTHMDAVQQHEMALHGLRNLEIKLERITAALARLRAGTYGQCAECGGSIPVERLEFMPEMPFCSNCNERFGR